MKRFALAIAAALTLAVSTFSANAADMPAPHYAPGYSSYNLLPKSDWTGFYVGFNAGRVSSSFEQHYVSGSYFNDLSMDAKGWQYEVDAMYLHQFGNNFVLGAKTAINFGGGTGSMSVDNCIGCIGFSNVTSTTIKKKWGGSTEVILGYSFLNDKLLGYAGAGIGYGKFQVDSVENWSGSGFSGSYSTSDASYGAGLALELGAMYKLSDNLVAKAFYRDTNYNLGAHVDTYAHSTTKYHEKAYMGGISYKFDGF